MTKEELFDAWAPEGVEWCAWAKPVLFAQWPESITPAATDPDWPDANYLWLPQASGRTVLVIDLPAVESVRTGIAFRRTAKARRHGDARRIKRTELCSRHPRIENASRQ